MVEWLERVCIEELDDFKKLVSIHHLIIHFRPSLTFFSSCRWQKIETNDQETDEVDELAAEEDEIVPPKKMTTRSCEYT